MLIRTWNLFHGNTVPAGRRAYLREMVELAVADKPAILCLQEVPVWALDRLAAWSGMQAIHMRARRSVLGPFPIPAAAGRGLTATHTGLWRSAFAGQGNATLIPSEAKVREVKGITLNTNPFVEEQGRKLGLSPKLVRWWERERRVCQLVKFELPNRRRFLVANLHATSYAEDTRLADAELTRAARFVDRAAELEEILVMAGDFNITRDLSGTIKGLLEAAPESRWTHSGPQIDHVLVRGAAAKSVRVWPDSEREYNGRLLSDHAPVDVELDIDPPAASSG
jgi:endonuclease/exonuclease/phosphatase family metal-dependent hydrolase